MSNCPYCHRLETRRSTDQSVGWCGGGHWWYRDVTWIEKIKGVLSWNF